MILRNKLTALAIAAALSLGAACKSAGHDKSDTTARHMDDLRMSVETLKTNVDSAATSLWTVVEKREVDPKPPFDQYKKDVSAVVGFLSRAESNLKAVRAEGQAYFAEWEKQAAAIQDPELKEASEARRAKLTEALEEIGKAMDAARTELAPFVATIQDVQTYLSNDLTPAGVDSIEGKAKKLRKDAESIGEKLDDVVEAVEEGSPAFKTAKPPPPAEQPKK